MKRTIILLMFNFSIALAYVLLLLLSIFGIIFPFYKTWFSFALIFLGFMLLPRFIAYGVNTNLWSGAFLILCGGFGYYNYYANLNLVLTLSAYLVCIALASLLMFFYFRQIFHFKIFTFTTLFAIILYVYECGLIKLWLALTLTAFQLLIIIVFVIKSILSNMRKV